MSLILDALRKSEAERRRGQVPGLHVERAPAALAARDGPPLWLWLALALAFAVVIGAGWLMRGWWSPALSADGLGGAPLSAEAIASQPAPLVTAGEREAEPAIADMAASADSDVGSPARATAATSATSRAISSPTRHPAPARTSGTTPTVATSASAAPAPTLAAAPPIAARMLPAPTVAAPTASVTAPQRAPAALPPAPSSPLASTAPPVAADPAARAVVRLSDLSPTERRALPPLKMSMHMWAPSSARRFAIIDGARVGEGDRIGEAVVEQITADAVVLAWHGRRVRLPVR